MSSPFASSPITPAYERRSAHKMNAQSPSSSWLLDQSTPLGELTWSKSHGLSSIPALDTLDINDVFAAEAGTSSGSSTYSESDAFSSFGMHHLPAWSTVAINRKAQGSRTSAAGAAAAGSVSRGVSPAAGISPSGLSDDGPVGSGHGINSFGGSMDDVWFLSSPGASEPRPTPAPIGGLQRKKKMHFKPSYPSSLLGGGADRDNEDETVSASRARTLKSAKSMPQVDRRVSSNYTSRLEDLLSEMGWPRQEPDSFLESEEEAGDTTIQGMPSGSFRGPTLHSAPLQQSQSYAGFTQAAASPYASAASVPSSSSYMTMSASSSGMPAAAPSALFQRRAVAREGTMPTPSPVAIPRRSQENEAPKTDGGVIPIRMDSRQQPSPANLIPLSAGLSASDNGGLTPASAQTLFAQSFDGQFLPQAHAMSNAAGTGSMAGPSRSAAATTLQSALSQQAAGQSGNNGATHPMFFYGHPVTNTRSSIGSSASGLSMGSGNLEAAQARQQNMSFGISPVSSATRSLTASTTSNYTELLTPITPFSNMQFNNSSSGHWAATQPFDVQSLQASQPEFGFIPLPTKIGSSDPTMPGFTNALGLYHDPSTVPEQAQTLNPTAIIDPAAYAHLLGAGLLNPADLSAATKFNRARASTAMAALEMPRNGPRTMRSQPNLRTTPPATAIGLHKDHPMPFSTQTTPHKTPRKIASNRRLNMQTPTSPASASHHHLPPQSPLSAMKRARSGLALNDALYGASGRPSSRANGAFEFINYGIDDADELCSAVAPSGSYKIPLKGFGSASGAEDEDEEFGGNDSDDGRSGGEGVPQSPRRTRRRGKSTSNRQGPRWEAPVPPLPGFIDGPMALGLSSTRSANDVPLPPTSPLAGQTPGRQVKRRKSDASMQLAGRLKSASMANLRK